MKKVLLFLGIMAGMFILVVGWNARLVRAASYEIKFAHVDPADPYTSKKGAAAVTFKGDLESATSGAVSVKLFAAGQLGGERELIEAVKLGTIQMAMVSAAIASYYKEAQVLDIPYLFSSAPVAWRVMDGPFGKDMAADCLKKTGLRILAYGETGFRNFTNSVRPIKSPADMKGMKIRVMESPVYVAMIKGLGAQPTPIAWPETYTALEEKVVDGEENPISVIASNKFYEVQKYLTIDGHSYGVDFIIINDKFYESLPKDIQQDVKLAAINAGWAGRGNQEMNSAIGVGQLQEKGMQIYKPTASELNAFRQATQKPVIEYMEKQVGKLWIDKLQRAVKSAEAELAK